MNDNKWDARLTHKGWFWFCPIYIGEDDFGGALVEARQPWLEWLFDLAELCESARVAICCAFIPDYEPTFVFHITGERKGKEL